MVILYIYLIYNFYDWQGPLSIIAGVVLGSLWGAMSSYIPEKGDIYLVPLRFLALFLWGLFSLFISSMIGWSGAGKIFIELNSFYCLTYIPSVWLGPQL